MPRPPRVVVVGCGWFSRFHLAAWRELAGEGLAEIAGVADAEPARARAAAAAAGGVAWSADAAALIDAERPDVIDIVAPPAAHAALVALAAGRGIDAICQKPLAPTLADAQAMAEACARAGTALTVHENWRWQPALRAALARARDLGARHWARVSLRSGRDVFRDQPALARAERFILADLGVHLVDVARCALGEFARVSCATRRVDPAIAGEDTATILLHRGDGGCAVVDCSYAPRLADGDFPQTRLRIEGERGSVEVEPGHVVTLARGDDIARHVHAPAPRPWFVAPGEAVQASVLAFQRDWLACRAAGRSPETDVADNLRTLALIDAAYASAARGGATVEIAAAAAGGAR